MDDLRLCWVSSECSKYCIAPVASIIFLIRDSLKSWPAVLVVLPPGRYHFREGHRSSLTHVASIDFLSRVPVCLPTVDGAPLQRVGVDTGVRSLYGDDDKTTKREVGENSKGVPTLALTETNPSGSQATPRGGVESDFVAQTGSGVGE